MANFHLFLEIRIFSKIRTLQSCVNIMKSKCYCTFSPSNIEIHKPTTSIPRKRGRRLSAYQKPEEILVLFIKVWRSLCCLNSVKHDEATWRRNWRMCHVNKLSEQQSRSAEIRGINYQDNIRTGSYNKPLQHNNNWKCYRI